MLLRESYREGCEVGKRTLANLSSLSAAQIDAVRAALRGQTSVSPKQAFEAVRSPAHAHVQAVALTLLRLDFASLVAPRSRAANATWGWR